MIGQKLEQPQHHSLKLNCTKLVFLRDQEYLIIIRKFMVLNIIGF